MAGIHLTWSPRVRGEGAGLGSADGVTDAPPTWEGLFEIEVWVGATLVKTVSDIDDDEYKFYTEEIKEWGEGYTGYPCCPSQIIFKLRNYRTEGATEFSSEKTVLKLRNYDGCDCGTATTTTTSTSSTTTSTSSSSSTSSSTTA